MLSFFSKKRHSPDTPPEEAIQGPDDAQQNIDSGFTIIDKETIPDKPVSSSIYPPALPAPFGLPYPVPDIRNAAANTNNSSSVPSYVQGVPFVLAPGLCINSTFEVTQMEVDHILAMMTRQMSVDETKEYNFKLERTLQNQY